MRTIELLITVLSLCYAVDFLYQRIQWHLHPGIWSGVAILTAFLASARWNYHTRGINSEHKRKISGALIIVSMIIFFGAFVYRLADKFQREANTDDWPSTNATVVSVDVYQRPLNKGESRQVYEGNWFYNFIVDGEKYNSNSRSVPLSEPGHYFDSPTRAIQRAVEKHPVGSKITIFYDPNDPNRTVLKKLSRPMERARQVKYVSYVLLVIGVISLIGVDWKFKKKIMES